MNTVQNFIRKSRLKQWKTGWTPQKVLGSQRVKERVPAFARISKGPRNLSESLWDGQVVQKNLALMKACSPTVKFRAGDLFASVGP